MGRVYTNPNQLILSEMIRIYQPTDIDWMYYPITKKNVLTLHHIEKEADSGITIIENGAILTKKAHRHLNMIESRDYKLYVVWNALFELINRDKQPPCIEYLNEARQLRKYTQQAIYEKET